MERLLGMIIWLMLATLMIKLVRAKRRSAKQLAPVRTKQFLRRA